MCCTLSQLVPFHVFTASPAYNSFASWRDNTLSQGAAFQQPFPPRNPHLTELVIFSQTGRSPLHWACTRGNTAVVMALLEAGADGSARDGSGKTPLHCAAQVGHTTVVMVLLEFYGFAPIGLPPGNVPAPLAALAVEAEEISSSMTAAMPQQNGVESIVDARNVYGSTALHRAAFNGREGVVLALLRGGADVCVVGNSGRRVQTCSLGLECLRMYL